MAQFEKMVEDHGFKVISASQSIEAVFADLNGQMLDVLNNGHAASAEPIGTLQQAPRDHVIQHILRAEAVEEGLAHIDAGPR